MMSWKMFVARTGVGAGLFGVAMFAAIRLAAADPGGPTRPGLTFAGVLRRDASGAPFVGTTTLTFQFSKGGASACSATTAPIVFTEAMGGAFTVEVPIGSPCPPQLFDGSDVTYSVQQDLPSPSTVATGVRVTPVPYARFADQAGVNNDCPAGYTRSTVAADTAYFVCVRTVMLAGISLRDEVVKVGAGASAFWIDRYEASVYRVSTGLQVGTATLPVADNIDTSGLTRLGQRMAGDGPARAFSRTGPSTGNITWFQANEACAASGKQLPTGSQWLRAASGTSDPVSGGACNVSATGPRPADASNGCVSSSGAHDMVGNLREWTDEWYAGLNTNVNLDPANRWVDGPGASFQADGTYNVTSYAYPANPGVNSPGLPAAALRGGGWTDGAQAGVFSLTLAYAPSYWHENHGFRCVVLR
jgi:formylglycine-generating enzyme required for sulfatase activity